MRKTIYVLAILIAVILLIFAFDKMLNGRLYTDDIQDYNSKKYQIPQTVFLPEIPENAEVVEFSYYNYWHEARDVYLELKFQTKAEMDDYLRLLKENGTASCNKDTSADKAEWFVEETNIYDQSFTDLFCLIHCSEDGEGYYTGYRTEVGKDGSICACNFGVISFSYEKLTVIQSCTHGWYREAVHDYVPKYLVRFGVPVNENHDRRISIG